jgi:hypothetical protein
MRAIKGDDKMKARQGALDMNAYLITKLSDGTLDIHGEDMEMLYLNLLTLSKSANTSLAIQRTIIKNASQCENVITSEPQQSKQFECDLESL